MHEYIHVQRKMMHMCMYVYECILSVDTNTVMEAHGHICSSLKDIFSIVWNMLKQQIRIYEFIF